MKLNENYINVPTYDEFESQLNEDEALVIDPSFSLDLDFLRKQEEELNAFINFIQTLFKGSKIEGVSDRLLAYATSGMINLINNSVVNKYKDYTPTEADKKFAEQLVGPWKQYNEKFTKYLSSKYESPDGCLLLNNMFKLSLMKFLRSNYMDQISKSDTYKKNLETSFKQAQEEVKLSQDLMNTMIKKAMK